MSLILAIETSCDDTCAAVVTGDGVIKSNVISSQAAAIAMGPLLRPRDASAYAIASSGRPSALRARTPHSR